MEEEGGARRGWPAASGGRMEVEAGTESSEEDEVTAAQIGGGRRGRTGGTGVEGETECVCECDLDRIGEWGGEMA